MKKFINIKKLKYFIPLFIVSLSASLNPVFAAEDPTTQVLNIIGRITSLATQVGAAVLLLIIVWDGINFVTKKDEFNAKSVIIRDIAFLIIAAIFLFNPNFILSAIKFIAGVN